jgi:hypothetical protein
MAHDVFISYSAEDRSIADTVAGALEDRAVRCWIAPRDVLPGVVYSEAIIGAINASRVLVLVFSSRSNVSPHVMREVERAVNKRIPIIPLRIEDVPLSPSMEYFVSTPQWLDALTPPLEPHLERLADTVARLLATGDAELAGRAPSVPIPGRSTPVIPTVSARGVPAVLGRPIRPSAPATAIAVGFAALVTLLVIAPSLLRDDRGAIGSPSPPGASAAPATPTPSVLVAAPTAAPTPAPSARATPADGPTVAGSFAAPGDTAAGMAWDGTNLWVSGSAELFKVSADGRVLGVYAPPSYTPEGLTWDGSRFLIFTTDGSQIYRFSINEADPASEPDIDATIDPPSRTIGGTNHALAWDGTNLWFSESFTAYSLDAGGRILRTLAFGREIAGMAWDGSRLWLAQPNWPDPATIVAVDVEGNELLRFDAPLVEVSAMVWVGDGQLLAAGSDEFAGPPTVFRIDVGSVP